MSIPKIDYGKGIDCEMVALCDTLNSLPGIHTIECCGGHGKESTVVFFYCTSLKSLAKIQRAIDRRYGGLKNQWTLRCSTTDTARYGSTLLFVMQSDVPYRNKHGRRRIAKRAMDDYEPSFGYDIGTIINNIRLYCTRWGDAVCHGKYSECPDATWKRFHDRTMSIEHEFDLKMMKWKDMAP